MKGMDVRNFHLQGPNEHRNVVIAPEDFISVVYEAYVMNIHCKEPNQERLSYLRGLGHECWDALLDKVKK